MSIDITPVLLTFNEAKNIERTLAMLNWARDIVVVDSFSDDKTVSLASRFSQVRIFQRKFDSHAAQWNFSLKETAITTDWVLALDADYVLTDDCVKELKALHPDSKTAGYQAGFIYCISGKRLRASVYPPVTVLYRKEKAHYLQDGHTQRLSLDGEIAKLNSFILHDDQKDFGHWFSVQKNYAKLEAKKLVQSSFNSLNFPDQLRKIYLIAPFAMFFYCLFVKGVILDGIPGITYAFQRFLAELLLSMFLIQNSFERLKTP